MRCCHGSFVSIRWTSFSPAPRPVLFFAYEAVCGQTLGAVSAIAIVSVRPVINVPRGRDAMPSAVWDGAHCTVLFPTQLNVLQYICFLCPVELETYKTLTKKTDTTAYLSKS